MDWTLAIQRNRDALLRVVAALFAYAGLADGAVFSVLPRHVYRAVLRVLRPAESAVRRLIIIAAHGLVLKAIAARAAPVGLVSKSAAQHTCAFPLIDPLKRFLPFAQDHQDGANTFDFVDEDESDSEPKATVDDSCALPRISVPGVYEPTLILPSVPSPYDLINAAHLGRRFEALSRALANLPKQARRLARWQARRSLALTSSGPLRQGRISPFRPGLPPGHRQRSIHEIDDILRECHGLALEASTRPDTS
ncbi:MAG: hypothetical protein ACRCU5_03920 [Rhizobiaceae bacterium]